TRRNLIHLVRLNSYKKLLRTRIPGIPPHEAKAVVGRDPKSINSFVIENRAVFAANRFGLRQKATFNRLQGFNQYCRRAKAGVCGHSVLRKGPSWNYSEQNILPRRSWHIIPGFHVPFRVGAVETPSVTHASLMNKEFLAKRV